MKKLMFAAAIAASAAAFADPINAISFENSQYASIDNATNLTGKADIPDPGRESATGATGYYFLYEAQSGSSDSSFVTNVAAAFTDGKITGYYNGLENYSNQKYLALDTEGGTLWRSIGQLTGNNDALGTAQAVAATGTYLDTLVQFTVTEDEAPTVGEGDKLAIWLQAGEGTTNLMVKANYWASAGEDPVATAFEIDGLSIEPGTWHRLTVKAIPSITTTGAPFPAFQIFVDGTSVAAKTPQYGEDFQDVASGRYVAGIGELVAANKLFPTLASRPSVLEDVTLQGVGFQGTGAVDEIVWTEDNPFPAATIDFTLTWTASEVSAVSYVLSTDLATTNSLTSGTAVQLAPGDGTATIELIPTFETGYEFDKVTMGETDLGLTFAIPGVTTNATLFAKAAAPAYPTYIDTTDTTIKGKYDAWKQAVGFDDSSTSTHLNQFLLNVDESATVGDTALEITEIKQNATAGWDITIGCSLDGVALTGTVGETIVCNGYLAVSYTDSLTGTWTTENIAVTAVDATTGTVTVNVNKANAKFMKVTLTAAPQAAANN